MLRILNKILANQLDPTAVMEKLDEIALNVRAMTPRRLTQPEFDAIKKSAQDVCLVLQMVNVTASNGNQEAQRYAMDFVNALKGAGCRADLALPIPGLTPDVTGLYIGVRDYPNIGSAAQILGQVLSGAGIQFRYAPVKPDFFPSETYVLIVGAKPN